MMSSIPSEAWTINDWYKQPIYDLGDNKIGEVKDVLLDHEGKTAAIILSVGGFLGLGEKDVAAAPSLSQKTPRQPVGQEA